MGRDTSHARALHSSAHARRCRFHIHYSYIQHAPSDRINTIVRTNKIWIVQHVEDCLATPTVHSRSLNTPTNHTQALPRTNTCYVNTACTHDSFHINEQTTICTIKRVKKTLTIAVRTLNHQRRLKYTAAPYSCPPQHCATHTKDVHACYCWHV